MKKLTVEEAYDVWQSGEGFILGGGYIFYAKGYASYGTFPGCLRTGSCIAQEKAKFITWASKIQWYKPTAKELILKTGYSLQTYDRPVWEHLVGLNKDLSHEWFLIETDAIRYMIDSEYTSEQFSDPKLASVVWKEFFDKREKTEV